MARRGDDTGLGWRCGGGFWGQDRCGLVRKVAAGQQPDMTCKLVPGQTIMLGQGAGAARHLGHSSAVRAGCTCGGLVGRGGNLR